MKNYKFCPYCGSPSEKHKYFFACPKCGKKVFMNSHPTSSAFIIEGGKYLISKRAIEPKKGTYDVVGGFLNNGEHPETGIVREFKEETGSSVKIVALLGIYLGKYEYQKDIVSTFNICYVGKLTNYKIVPKDDVASFHWFPITTIPTKLSEPWLAKAIKDLQNGYEENKIS